MKREDVTDIEMEFRDVLGVIFNETDPIINKRRFIEFRMDTKNGENQYQREEPKRLGAFNLFCGGSRVAFVQRKPHNTIKIYNAYDAHSCFVQKILERVAFSYFPKATVSFSSGE